MRFADIPYHDDVKRKLREMADSGRIPHALVLEGPPGSGKYALARAFAQYLHCTNHTADGDSCGTCPACQQHATFNHIDTVFTFPVVKRENKKEALSDDYVSEFREFLTDSPYMDSEAWTAKFDKLNAQPRIYVEEAAELIRKLLYTSHGASKKIVLMWQPEKMLEPTANKLLKLIEEPFEDTVFVMSSDNPSEILPTIYSRVQRLRVNRYTDDEVARYLTTTYSISDADAAQVARLAHGNINAATNLISASKESKQYLELFMYLMRKAYLRDVGALKTWAADLAALGREREIRFWEYCAHMVRENFILNMRQPALSYLNADEYNFSIKFSPFINERNVLGIFNVINDARADIAGNANAKLVNFDVAIKMILLIKQ